MILHLYSNFKKKENSTKIPLDTGTVVNVTLKRATSLLNPVFLLEGVNLDVNYCHLENGRYYFVDDIVLGNNNLYELHCRCDYLASFRNDIFNSEFYVERSASRYNNMFIDPLVSVQSNVVSRDYTFNNTGFDANDGSYVVRIAGGDSDGISTYIVDDLTELSAIFNKSNYFATTDDSFKQLIGNYIFDPYDYVVDLYWSPISLSTLRANVSNAGHNTQIKVKWFNTGISAFKLYNNKVYRASCGCTVPHSIYSDFRLFDPRFSRYYAYIPAVGNIDLSYENAKNLMVEYYINLDTGACRVTLINLDGNTFFASYNTNVYKSIQYAEAHSSAGAVLGGTLNTIGGFVSGNIPLGVTGGISTISNIIVPTPSIAGSNSGLGLQGANKVILCVDNYGSGGRDIVNNGAPLCEKVLLWDLNGFCKCGNASIECNALSVEKDHINNYLNSGFFIE